MDSYLSRPQGNSSLVAAAVEPVDRPPARAPDHSSGALEAALESQSRSSGKQGPKVVFQRGGSSPCLVGAAGQAVTGDRQGGPGEAEPLG